MPPGEKYPSLQTPNPTPAPSVGSTSNCQNKERRRREFVIFRPLETTRSGSSNLSWWSRDSTLQARGGTAGVGKRAAQFSPPCERECFDVGQLVLINSTCPPFLMGWVPAQQDWPTNQPGAGGDGYFFFALQQADKSIHLLPRGPRWPATCRKVTPG